MIFDQPTVQSLIAALGTVAAAFVGVLTWFLASRADRRREREELEVQKKIEAQQREQRVLDVVLALHSEILAGIVANRRQLTADDVDYAMRNENPFATADETDFVFDSVKGDLSILPAEVIHSVVQYYRAAQQSNLLTRDLRDPHFLSQTPPEKQRIIALLLQVVELQKILGEAAVKDLAIYARSCGLDLSANERRAETLIARARQDINVVFKRSEQSDPSLKPPGRRRPAARDHDR